MLGDQLARISELAENLERRVAQAREKAEEQVDNDFARRVALELLGPDRVTLNGPALNGSEDFAVMLEHCPGSYLLIGNGDGAGGCMVHHPGYDFHDDNIGVGAAYWALLAERFLVDAAPGL